MNTTQDNVDRLVDLAQEYFSDVTNTNELVDHFQSALHMLVDNDKDQQRHIEEIFAHRLEEARRPIKFLTTPIASWEDHYMEQEMQFAEWVAALEQDEEYVQEVCHE